MSPGEQWVFDLDGTLADGLSATRLRPGSRDLLVALRGSGARVLLWSAGGTQYARRVAERLGIAQHFDAIEAKVADVHGSWILPDGWDVGDVSCVDDEPGRLPAGVRVVAVRPWLGGADAGLSEIVGGRPGTTA